ncbi:2-dehydro-3-deoxyphosphogluconate aldolase/(4S)-4-hydroxy-2-oxoglutarate aldolase [Blastococcus colisei]|uniref:2-dehydro-3-deoxyphosphogluconate aldolase/(4S)-4-hydroxy-2-oxoglutarate aldolase n=1 Tax=Blastococcus colisei TaxID=1564162 RepID=A0A543PE66_9ACTN|nr:bifunctional 4-hydroxy-2-oxoglutarate aldolase/2-dehydro-3-deoxy-phosphogluconate aldolase [Blastococcus colisei]TQN42381.1 2-dehydro-3-deoxyphosphogluconate aldolase/(4S)-4-hydroxy-2-oxoglutarate aldolase [Blastococcus colisei]
MTSVDAAVRTGADARYAVPSSIVDRLARLRVVPVAVVHEVAHAEPLAEALVAGGLPCVEVTMRTEHAERVLGRMAERTDLLVGAGTVIRPDQVERVVAAGARFVVTPGFSPSVVSACREAGVPVIPGVATATEILMALDAGLDLVKFFPAEASGGLKALSALSGPFGAVRFIPTGGVTPENIEGYLGHRAVLAVGGTWLAAPALLAAEDFAAIEQRTREAVLRVASLTSAHRSGEA